MTLLAQQGEEPNQSPTNTPDSHAQLPPPKPRPTPAEQPGGPHGADASLGELVAQLGEQMSRLARDELALAVVEDLDLDLWRSADGTDVRRLDEDEFEESGLRESDPEAAAAAETALDELESLARDGGFDDLLV